MGRNSIHNIGDRHGFLEIIEIISQNNQGSHVKLNCYCHNCGMTKIMNSINIKKRNSCGCCQRISDTWANVGPKTKPWQLPEGQSAKNELFYQYKRSAKKRNLDWNLTEEQFFDIVTGNCYYCDSSLDNTKRGQGKTSGDFKYTGIDRFNNSIGYTKDNCVACCWMCNNMKSSYTNIEFINKIIQIYNHKIKEFING